MTEEKTEEQKELESKIFSPEEIHDMFDTGFLAKLHEFAKRMKKDIYPDKNINCYMARMHLKFEDLESELTYESIKEAVNLQLQPVFQEDLDKEKERSKYRADYQQLLDVAKEAYDEEIKRIDGDGDGGEEPA